MKRAAQRQNAPWLVSVAYQRDAAEELRVALAARKRFTRPLGENFTYQSLLFLIVVFVVLVIAIEATRRLSPFFEEADKILLYHAQFWAAFLPLLLIAQVAMAGYGWMLRRKRESMLRERIRAKGWTDFEVTETGLKMSREGEDLALEWRAVRNISHSKDLILFDLDETAIYLPERAFKDRMTFLQQYKLIRQTWHNCLMDRVAEQDLVDG